MKWKTDWGLRFRMALTMALLGGIYILFAVVILEVLGAGQGVVLFAFASLGLVQFFFSDKLALWSMGAREVSEDEYPQLHAMVGRLAQQADLPKPKVAVVDSDVPNAFATGRSKKNSVVAVHTGLLKTLDREELEGVVAHELAHVKNRDVAVMTVASFLSTVAFMVVRWGWLFGGGNRRDSGGAGILVAITVSFVVWILSFFLIRALSRYREYSADRGGASITGNPLALASALQKISGRMDAIPERDMRDEAEMNAFFIIPIRKGFIGRLFSTHPPTEVRVERLKELAVDMETA